MSNTNTVNLPNHKRGDTWDGLVGDLAYTVGGAPVSFTGASIVMQVRTLADRDSELIADWSTASADIVIPVNGLTFEVPARKLDWPPATYFYEIQITYADATVRTAFEGTWPHGQDLAHVAD